MPTSYYKYVAGITWASGLSSLSRYFAGRPPQANGDFTFMLSEVDVETASGVVVPRVIGFVSSGGLPRALRLELQNSDILVLRANGTGQQGHAEVAARDYAQNEFDQQLTLNGKLVRVNSAVMNNTPCSQDCADAFNSYSNTGRGEDEDQMTITTEDRGFLPDGQIIDPAYADELRAQTGGINVFNGLAEEGMAEADDGGDE